jgi:hypothetical protein
MPMSDPEDSFGHRMRTQPWNLTSRRGFARSSRRDETFHFRYSCNGFWASARKKKFGPHFSTLGKWFVFDKRNFSRASILQLTANRPEWIDSAYQRVYKLAAFGDADWKARAAAFA